jgi:hypothetical protein
MDRERGSYHHHPDYVEERRRTASRAATLGNSKIGAEIRNTRLMVRDLVEAVVSGDLDPIVRKRLTEVVQLLQAYARLAELEIAAGERPRTGDVALAKGIYERVRELVEGEEAKMREGIEMAEELSQTMQTNGRDPTPIREAVGV